MTARRTFITLLGGAPAWPPTARAQQAEPTRRIGVLTGGLAAEDVPGLATFLHGMRKRREWHVSTSGDVRTMSLTWE